MFSKNKLTKVFQGAALGGLIIGGFACTLGLAGVASGALVASIYMGSVVSICTGIGIASIKEKDASKTKNNSFVGTGVIAMGAAALLTASAYLAFCPHHKNQADQPVHGDTVACVDMMSKIDRGAVAAAFISAPG